MDSVAKAAIAYDSMIKSAEAYEAHGLYDEALVLYKNIIADVSDLDEDVRKRLQYKIEELSSEIEDKDQEVPHDLSSEEVTHLKTGLSIGESAPEICDSAGAFKELGLYKEAVAEYLKLFQTDYPIENFVSDFLECMMSIHQPSKVVDEIEKFIREKKIADKQAASIKFALGGELSKRDYREQAIKCYEAVAED